MKTTTTHTPGPWFVELPFQEPGLYVQSKSTQLICRLIDQAQSPDPQSPEGMANARLIAAAPELLEALQGIIRNAGYESGEALPTLQELNVSRKYLDKAREAIAKAIGSES